MQVIKPGTRVKIGQARDIEGLILQVNVAIDGAIQYQVAWWDKSDRTTDWLYPCEINVMESGGDLAIGFASLANGRR